MIQSGSMFQDKFGSIFIILCRVHLRSRYYIFNIRGHFSFVYDIELLMMTKLS